uniref:Uncharacterized protein n=1 Tax=Hyaloperonospora arabidopsidis (strain Emoy2) TaxID=559515 RepID=M4B9E8_HYAAE
MNWSSFETSRRRSIASNAPKCALSDAPFCSNLYSWGVTWPSALAKRSAESWRWSDVTAAYSSATRAWRVAASGTSRRWTSETRSVCSTCSRSWNCMGERESRVMDGRRQGQSNDLEEATAMRQGKHQVQRRILTNERRARGNVKGE